MAYSTVEDVRNVLIGMRGESENKSANSLDSDQIQYAISSADAQVDAYLRKRYVLPIPTPIDPMVHALSVDISVYLSTLTYRIGREFASAMDVVELRYARAVALLKDIQSGMATLNLVELGTNANGNAVDDALTVFNPQDKDLFPPETVFADAIGYIPPDPIWREKNGYGYNGYIGNNQ